MMNRRLAVLVAGLAVVTTACFKSDIRIQVEDDGSGSVESLMAIDVDDALEFANAFALDGEEVSADEACEDFASDQDMPAGAVAEPYRQDGFCGVRYTASFAAGELQAALGASDGEFTLRPDGDGWYFEATSSAAAGEDDFIDPAASELLDGAEMTVGVLLPGRQIEHNATYIDADGTLVWEVDPTDTELRLFARSEPGDRILGSGPSDSGGSAMTIILVLVGLAAVAAGVGWLVVNRREGEGPGPTAAAAVAAGAAAPVSASPASATPTSSVPDGSASPEAGPSSSLPPPGSSS